MHGGMTLFLFFFFICWLVATDFACFFVLLRDVSHFVYNKTIDKPELFPTNNGEQQKPVQQYLLAAPYLVYDILRGTISQE